MLRFATSAVRIVGLPVLVSFLLIQAHGQQDESNKSTTEMQVLNKYIGRWDVTYETEDGGAEITAEWVLDGKFVKRTAKLTHAKMEALELLTFDSKEKCYRRWEFTSIGSSPFPGIETRGTWDDRTATMTWVTGQPASVGGKVTKNEFVNASTQKWEIQFRNDKNELVGHPQRGVSKIRK